jgi:hypothetical protein
VPAEDFRVAAYTHHAESGGWFNADGFIQPLADIGRDGAWAITLPDSPRTLVSDRVAVFLVPRGTDVPLVAGVPELPVELFGQASAHDGVERLPGGMRRLVFFSGFTWWVKSHAAPVGPGPNLFSDSQDNVWVDRAGRLHLRTTRRGDAWHCAEAVLRDSLGYGAYLWTLDSPVHALDPNVVLGLFTWSDAPDFAHREIDIEFARWADPANEIAQFVVQPYDVPGNMLRFNIGPDAPTLHGFDWQRTYVQFRGTRGAEFFSPELGDVIHEWRYTGTDRPVPGGENARMNLWLFQGAPPTDGAETEVVIRSFAFVP